MTSAPAPDGPALRVRPLPDAVVVKPGVTAVARVEIASSARDTLDVAVDLRGDRAQWARVAPSRLTIAPQGREVVTVSLLVPERLADHPGAFVIGVRARTSRPGVLPHVGEVRARIAVPLALRVELVPPVLRTSGRGRYTIVVRNDAPLPVSVRLEPGDAAPAARVRIRPSRVTVPPRGRATARATVALPAPWVGPEPDHQFTVRALVGSERIDAIGLLVQRTRVGATLLGVAALLIVLAVLMLVALVGGLPSA